jgi:hypothetical protein
MADNAKAGPSGTKYVRLTVDIWYDETDNHIHITSGQDFHSTLNDTEGSVRRHKNLFKHFRNLLIRHDRWHPNADPV